MHYCTKCDAPFYQGKTTASVGVGAYLLESGILLSRMASRVYVIFKGGRLGGDPDLIKSLQGKENVEGLVPNSSIKTITGNGTLQQITVSDRAGEETTIPVDGLFIEMGSKINLGFVKHLVELNPKGEIKNIKRRKDLAPGDIRGGRRHGHPVQADRGGVRRRRGRRALRIQLRGEAEGQARRARRLEEADRRHGVPLLGSGLVAEGHIGVSLLSISGERRNRPAS